MKLQLHDGLDEANKIRAANIVFEHILGVLIDEERLTTRLVLLLNEVFDLALRILEDLGVVVFEDALQLLFKHGKYLLSLFRRRIQICYAVCRVDQIELSRNFEHHL